MDSNNLYGNRRNRTPLGVTYADSMANKQAAEQSSNAPAWENPKQVDQWRKEADQEAAHLRKQAEAADKQAKVMRNVEQERAFRAAGAKFFKADDGNYYQDRDEQGRGLYNESDWELRDTKDGSKAEFRRNKYGESEARAAKLKAGESVDDSKLYYSDGSEAGHIDDLARRGDPVALKQQAARKAARKKSALAVLDRGVASAETSIYETKDARNRLLGERETITAQIAELEGDENFNSTVGEWFTSKKNEAPTAEAAPLRKRHSDLKKRLETIDSEAMELDFKLEGELSDKLKRAQDEKKHWEAQTELGKFEDLEAQRIAILQNKGVSKQAMAEDPLLQQIRADKERMGVASSELAQAQAQAAEVRANVDLGLSGESSFEEFESVGAELNETAEALNTRAEELAAMRKQVEAGKVDADEYNAVRAEFVRDVNEQQGKGEAFEKASEEFAKQHEDARIAEIEAILDRDEDFFNANWGDGLIGEAWGRLDDIADGVHGKSGYELDAKEGGLKNSVASAMSFSSALIEEGINLIRGSSAEDIERRDEQASVQQMTQGFRGQELRTFLSKQDEYTAMLNPEGLGGDGERIADDGRLGRMNDLLFELRQNKTTHLGRMSVSALETFASLGNLFNYMPGLDVSVEMRGIDRKNPEEVAKFNALLSTIQREVDGKHGTAVVLGSAGSSLAQFAVTRKMGNVAAGRLSKLMNKFPAVAPKLTKVGDKFKVSKEVTGAGLGYGMMGYSQSMSENPNEMGVFARALDGATNALVLATAERIGNKGEAALVKSLGASPTWKNLLQRKLAFTGAAFTGENISEIVEAGAKGEDAGEAMKEILVGNFGAVLGMGLLGVKGDIKTHKAYRHYATKHGHDLGELQNRLSDLNALVNTAKGHGVAADEARKALEIVGGVESVEQLNSFVETQLKPSEKGSLEKQLAWLEDQAPKVLIANQASEILQKKAVVNAAALNELGERFAERVGQEGPALREEIRNEQNAAVGLIKLANGNMNLTQAESAALQALEEERGMPLVREHEGIGVMTDGAMEWLTARAPSAGKLLSGSETEQVASIDAEIKRRAEAEQAKQAEVDLANDGVGDEKKNQDDGGESSDMATESAVDGSPDASPAAMVSYVDGDGQSQGAKIPAGATTAKGEPVTEANVGEWLAEQGKTVRKVNRFKKAEQSKPKQSKADEQQAAGKSAESAKPIAGPVKPGAILARIREIATKQIGSERAAKADGSFADVSKSFANNINAAIESYKGVFGDDKVQVVVEGKGSGGAYLSADGKLTISIDDLLDGRNFDQLRNHPERIAKIVEEEAIHAVATQVLGKQEVVKLWQSLPAPTRKLVTKAYGKGDSYQLGHEFVRMLVQGRIAVKGGKLEADGVAISEDLSGTGLLEKIADALAKIRDYFTDLRGSLEADGADQVTIDAVESAVSLVESTIHQLQNESNQSGRTTASDQDQGRGNQGGDRRDSDAARGETDTARAGDAGGQSVSAESESELEASPLGDTGVYKLQDGTRASYHFEIVDESEVIEDPRNTKPGMESFDTRKFVEKNSGANYDAELSFAIDPTFQQGAPMVERENGKLVIKGGHRRTYIRRNNRAAYEAALPQYAKRFGIDMAAAKDMKSPVIVAVLDEALTDAQRDSFITQLNETNQQGISTAWEATKVARKMTPEIVRTAGALFARHPDRTPLDVLQSADAAEFTDLLISEGVLSDQDAKKYVRENGALSNSQQGSGANLFKKVLLATVLDDPRTLDRIEGTPMETKLLNAIGPMVTLIDRGQDAKVLQHAIAAEAERLQLSPEPSVADFQSQESFDFEAGTSPESQAVHRWLASFSSKQSREKFTELVNDFAPNEDANQVGLFGEENQDIGEGLLARERGQAASALEDAILASRSASQVMAIAAQERIPLELAFDSILAEMAVPETTQTKLTMGDVVATLGKDQVKWALGKVRAHIARHKEHEASFKDQLRFIANKFEGSISEKVGLKGEVRGVQKLIQKRKKYSKKFPGHPEHGLQDILRNTIEVKSISDAYRVLAELEALPTHMETEDRFYEHPMPGGYRDLQVNLQLAEGVYAEVQINVSPMLRAKEVGHYYYEQARTTEDEGTKKQLLTQMEKLYQAAYVLAETEDVEINGSQAIAFRDSALRFFPFSTYAAASAAESNVEGPGNPSNKGASNVLPPESKYNALPEGVEGSTTNQSISASNPSLEPGGAEAKRSSANLKSNSQSLIHRDTTQINAKRQRVLLGAAHAVTSERKGKIQMKSLAAYRGDGNLLKVAYPAMRAGLDREHMPQIPSKHKQDFIAGLKADGVKVEIEHIAASKLRPTQAEIDASMVNENVDKGEFDSLNSNPILVTKDGYISDGHHRWGIFVTAEARGKQVDMRVLRVDLPLSELMLAMEVYGQSEGLQRRGINDHNYTPHTPLKARKATDTNQTSLFDLLGDDQPAKDYARSTPTKARKSKKAFKKQVAKEIPSLASNDAALGDLFAYAQSTLTKSGDERNLTKGGKTNEPIHQDDRPNGAGDTSQVSKDATKRTRADSGTSQDGELFGWGASQSESRKPGGDGGNDSGGGKVSGGAASVEGTEQGATQSGSDTTGTGGLAGSVGRPRTRPKYVADSLIPSERDHVIDPHQPLAPAGNKAKFDANIRAIELLRELERDNRNAKPNEKHELAAYTGWGWAGEYFNEKKEAYAKQNQILQELFTEEEYASARESTKNAHYTAPEVIDSIWGAVKHMGFEGGHVLEPAGGIGHFFGLMPKSIRRNSELHGVELDEISARIMTKLYPNASIKQQGFERNELPNNSIDLAISNVPFGDYTLAAKDYPKLFIHDYFFARSLDKVKPGGLVAFVTSDGTMQKMSTKVRSMLSEKADLVGAIRLPNNAFAANAGTQVTTDIIFLRKKDGSNFEGQKWHALKEFGEAPYKEAGVEKSGTLYVNEYFVNHPEMALGKHSFAGSMYRANQYALVADPNNSESLKSQLYKAVRKLPKDIANERTIDVEDLLSTRDAKEGELEGQTGFNEETGEFYQVRDGRNVEPAWYSMQNYGNKAAVTRPIDAKKRGKRKMIARDFLRLGSTLRTLLDAEGNPDSTNAQLTALRGKLNHEYDAYVKKWGTLSKQHRFLESAAFLEEHPDYSLLQSVEIEKTSTVPRALTKTEKERGDTGKKFKVKYSYVKGDIFRERIREPLTPPTSAASAADAVSISRSIKGGIDPAYIAKLLGTTEEDAMRQALEERRAFKDPVTGLWDFSENYLSGNVRKKLAAAKDELAKGDESYRENIAALEAIIPEDVLVHKISAQLSSRWLDDVILNQFIEDRMGTKAKIAFSDPLNGYTVSLVSDTQAQPEFGTDRVDVSAILRHALDGTEPVVRDSFKKPDGTTGSQKNKVATAAAVNKVKQLNRAFQSWMKTAEATVEVEKGQPKVPMMEYVERRYNDINNAVVPPQYNGEYLTLPGATKTVYKLPHRMSVVARILNEGSTMMAHGVGSGKTYSIIVSSYEMKRLGMAKKPLIVVQNATIGQFAASYRQAYPDGRVLVATERDLTKQFRKRFLNRIATGNWDAIIITQSQFNRIQSSEQSVKAYYRQQLDDLEDEIEKQKAEEGKRGPTVKQLEAMRKRLKTKLENQIEKIKENQDQDVMPFEDMGIDALFIDEAHEYKKVPIVTRKRNVKGIPADESQRAINLELKVRHIQQQTGGKNIVLATGTPITNSMAEAYVMLRLATPKVLEDYSINTFDDFANTFGEVQTKLEFTWKGTWANVTRFNKFVNLPELTSMIRAGFDVKMGNKELGLKVPEMEGGSAELNVVKQTPVTEKINEWILNIAETYENLGNEEKRDASWVPIVTMQAGMAGALDPRLIDPSLPDHPDSKVNTAVQSVYDIYMDDSVGVENKTQMIFADQFLPINTEKLDSFAGGVDHDIEIDDDVDESTEEATEEEEASDTEDKESAEAKAEGEAYKNATGFNLYKDIRDKLIAKGIPAEEIGIIHEYNTNKRRKEVFDKMNAGTLRILIGSTSKMGVGVNAHEKLYAAHHLDPPRQMTPAMMEQRDGRIIRQGNANKTVRNIRYGVEQSMDTGIYQLLENKGQFIHDALMGRTDQRISGDEAGEALMSMSEMKARLTGDLRIIRKAELDAKIEELELERIAHDDEKSANVRKKSQILSNNEYDAEFALPARKKMVQWFDDNVPKDKFEVRIEEGEIRTDKKQVLEHLQQKIVRLQQKVDDRSGVTGQSEREMIRFFWNEVPVELRIESKGKDGERTNVIRIKKPFELSPDNDQGFAGLTELYSTSFKSASSAFTILGNVRKAMTIEEQIAPVEAKIEQRLKQIGPIEKAINTPWERQADYDKLNAELEKLNAELEMGSRRNKRPIGREAANGLFRERLEPVNDLLSRAAETHVDEKARAAYIKHHEIPAHKQAEALADLETTLALASRSAQGQGELDLQGELGGDHIAESWAGSPQTSAFNDRGLSDAQEKARLAFILDSEETWKGALKANNQRVSYLIPELVKDANRSFDVRGAIIKDAGDAATLLRSLRSPYVESMKVLFVDNADVVLHSSVVSIGTTSATFMDPKAIGRELARHVDERVAGVIVAHNHPSGDPDPSRADLQVTRQLREATKMIGVPLIDHVITNGETYYSFAEAGLVDYYASSDEKRKPTKAERKTSNDVYRVKGVPAGVLAEWELAGQGARPLLDDPSAVERIRKKFGSGSFVIYVDRKNHIVGVDQVPTDWKADDYTAVRRQVFEGVGRNGATAIFFTSDRAKFGADKDTTRQVRALKDFSKAGGFDFIDAIMIDESSRSGIYSYADAGILSRIADPNQQEIDFDALAAEPETAPVAPKINRSNLLLDNMGLATYIAARFQHSMKQVDLADLIQEARIGLMKAAQNYDPAHGEFANFAGTVIRNRLRDVYKKNPRVSKVSIDTEIYDDHTATVGDTIADERATLPSLDAEKTETREQLASVLATLPPKPRATVERHMRGESFEDIAQSFGESKQATQQRYARAMDLLRRRMGERGLTGSEDGVLKSAAARRSNPGDLPANLAKVITSTRRLKQHAEFTAAKSGDVRAAKAIVDRVLKPKAIEEVRSKLKAGVPVILVPVGHADPGPKPNAMPIVYATRLETELPDATVVADIVKNSGAANTDVPFAERTANAQTFDGEVRKGVQYVLVDDTLTSGNTLFALYEHIAQQGGDVAAITALADGQYQRDLKPTDKVISKVLDKAGLTEEGFESEYGYPIQRLTGGELYRLANLSGKWSGLDFLDARIPAKDGSKSDRRRSRALQTELGLSSAAANTDSEQTASAIISLARELDNTAFQKKVKENMAFVESERAKGMHFSLELEADQVTLAAESVLLEHTDDPRAVKLLEGYGENPFDQFFKGNLRSSAADFAPLEERTYADYLADDYDDDALQEVFGEIEDNIFDSPTRIYKTGKIKDYQKLGEVMSEAEAKKVVDSWKAQAREDGRNNRNSDKYVLSLFDTSGVMSQPWVDAGYNVVRMDLDEDSEVAWNMDVMDITAEFLNDHGLDDVDVVIAQPPCTDFTCSGSSHFKAKDADGRTQKSVDLIHQTIATIGYLRPMIWTLENPFYTRLKGLTGLPNARLATDPFVYGDPYTKRTGLWGDFNANLPRAVVEPRLGSMITEKLSGSSKKGKAARSLTPEGFAYAFYMANRDYQRDFADRVRRKSRENNSSEQHTPPMEGAEQTSLFSAQATDTPTDFAKLLDRRADIDHAYKERSKNWNKGGSFGGLTFAEIDELVEIKEQLKGFDAWFGDSKAVDHYGRPAKMYHITDKEFDTFNTDTVFVSPEPDFTGISAAGNNVTMELYVKAEKPFDLLNPRHRELVEHLLLPADAGYLNELKNHYDVLAIGETDAYREVDEATEANEEYDGFFAEGDFAIVESEEIQAAIKEMGFDSFVVRENGTQNLAVLSREQVKSATSNNGDFDPNHPSILAARQAEAMAQPPADQLQQLAFLEDWAAAHDETLDELIGNEFEFEQAASKWRKAHPARDFIDKEVASRMANADDDAVKNLMDLLGATVPDSSQLEREAQDELDGNQTIGRPDLANPAASKPARRFVNALDEARKEKAEVQTHAGWEADARAMIAKDKLGTIRRLLEVAEDPRYNGLTDAVDVKAAQILVAEMVEKAVTSRNPELMRKAQILTHAYRESGTETARAMAARRDPHKTPAERHKEFLASVFFRPDRKTAKRIKQAPSAAEKSRDLDKLKSKLKQAEANAADKAEIVRLRREIVELKAQPSKTELLTEASSERLKRIEAELDKMGVTLEDIFSGETEVRLKADNIIGNYAGKLDEKRKQATEMLARGVPTSDIRKSTGLSIGELNDIREDFRREYYAKHKAKYVAAMKGKQVNGTSAEDLEVISLLKSGAANLSEAEIERLALQAMERDMAAMGFGVGRRSKSDQADKRKKSGVGKKRRARKSNKPRAQSVAGIDYEWEMDKPKRGDRHHQKPGQPDLGDALEPTLFDISDPIEVARVARVAEAIESNGFDMVYEYWINSILSGPQTHVANITGNALNATLDMTLQRGMEAAVNAVLTKVGMGDSSAPQFGEFKHMVRGIMPGIMEGYQAAVQAWGSETALFENRVLDKQIELGGMGRIENYKLSIKGKKGRIIRIPGRALLFMDEFFKGLIARAQVGAEAYRIAKGEGLKGKQLEKRITGLVNQVGSDAWHKAAERAIELTFQNDPVDGTMGGLVMSGMSHLRNTIPGARYIIPFLRTILNIFTTGVRKSPVGSLNIMGRVAKGAMYKIKDGTPMAVSYPRPEFIRHAAEQVLAFGATALVYGAAEGDEDDDEKFLLITGSRPMSSTSYGVSKLYNRAGLPAYSLRIGDFVFQYGRYEPVSTALGVTVDSIKMAKQSDQIAGNELLGRIVANVASNLTDKTFARGISDLAEVIQKTDQKFANWSSNFISSFVPNLIKQPIRVMDSHVRETSMESKASDLIPRMVERTVESALPIPGMRPVDIDIWGNEVEKEGNALSRLVVPQRAGRVKPLNRVDRMLLAWNRQNPAETYAPQPPRRSFTHDGERLYMNDAEFIAYQKTRGQVAFKLLSQMPLNLGTPTEKDLEKVKRALSLGHKQAKAQLLRTRNTQR